MENLLTAHISREEGRRDSQRSDHRRNSSTSGAPAFETRSRLRPPPLSGSLDEQSFQVTMIEILSDKRESVGGLSRGRSVLKRRVGRLCIRFLEISRMMKTYSPWYKRRFFCRISLFRRCCCPSKVLCVCTTCACLCPGDVLLLLVLLL